MNSKLDVGKVTAAPLKMLTEVNVVLSGRQAVFTNP